MKKKYRIKKNSEIDAIFKKKKIKSNLYFAIYHESDTHDVEFRFGMSIGKKFGNAVERNKIKRQVRSIIHEHKKLIINHVCFIVVIKPTAKNLSFDESKNYLITLLKKSKIMENNDV